MITWSRFLVTDGPRRIGPRRRADIGSRFARLGARIEHLYGLGVVR
jgi:hypothetical protein